MTLRTRLRAGLAVLLLAITGVVGSASPAAAGPVPSHEWYFFNGLTSNWHCSTTVGEAYYAWQACVVVSGTNYQGVLLLKSYRSNWSWSGFAENIESTVGKNSRWCVGEIPAGTTMACFALTQAGTAGNAVQGKVQTPDYVWAFSPSIMLPN